MKKRVIIWCAVSSDEQAQADKNSLPTQLKQGRERALKEDWQIIDELIVDGHSRHYIDIHDLAFDARQKGIRAVDKLISHLKTCDFDVLWCWSSDRLGRSQTIISYIVESVIRGGLAIHSETDGGYMDVDRLRMWNMVSGYQTSHAIDNFIEKRKFGMDKRVEKGLPPNAPITPYLLIRDSMGKSIGLELNPKYKQEWRDLADLILAAVPLSRLPDEMLKLGYSDKGKRHPTGHYSDLLQNPFFWGHSARRFTNKPRGAWIRELGHVIPDGVLIYYDQFEPVYTGELAEQIKAELTRREISFGKARHKAPAKYSGIFLCVECGSSMVYTVKGNFRALRCSGAYSAKYRPRSNCSNRKFLTLQVADDYIAKFLDSFRQTRGRILIEPSIQNHTSQLEQIESELNHLQSQIDILIDRQANSDNASVASRYDNAIDDLGNRLNRAIDKHNQLLAQDRDNIRKLESVKSALHELDSLGQDAFMNRPEYQVNQSLHRLLDNHRFVVQNGQVVGYK